jgi:hypothetical protein
MRIGLRNKQLGEVIMNVKDYGKLEKRSRIKSLLCIVLGTAFTVSTLFAAAPNIPQPNIFQTHQIMQFLDKRVTIAYAAVGGPMPMPQSIYGTLVDEIEKNPNFSKIIIQHDTTTNGFNIELDEDPSNPTTQKIIGLTQPEAQILLPVLQRVVTTDQTGSKKIDPTDPHNKKDEKDKDTDEKDKKTVYVGDDNKPLSIGNKSKSKKTQPKKSTPKKAAARRTTPKKVAARRTMPQHYRPAQPHSYQHPTPTRSHYSSPSTSSSGHYQSPSQQAYPTENRSTYGTQTNSNSNGYYQPETAPVVSESQKFIEKQDVPPQYQQHQVTQKRSGTKESDRTVQRRPLPPRNKKSKIKHSSTEKVDQENKDGVQEIVEKTQEEQKIESFTGAIKEARITAQSWISTIKNVMTKITNWVYSLITQWS